MWISDRAFFRFFRDAFAEVRRRPGTLLAVFCINAVFFIAAALLIRELLSGFWKGEVLDRLSRGTGAPLTLIHALGGRPLVRLTLPLALYLAFSATFSLATIFTGPLLTRMSGAMDPSPSGKPGLRGFFFELKEELQMLVHNINLSAGLFVLGAVFFSGPALATILFYLLMPGIYGLYALSYPALRRGTPYSGITAGALRRLPAFTGFSLAAATGYFLIFALAARVPWTDAPFLLLLGFAALWRTLAAAAGTRFAADFPMHPPQGGRALRRTGALASIALALLVLFTGAQAVREMRDRLGLLECRYRLEGIRPALSLQGVLADAALTITNPTRERIILPELRLTLHLGKETVATLIMEEKTVASGGTARLSLAAAAATGSALRALLAAFREGNFRVRLTGEMRLPLWFGSLRLFLLRL